jgi:guanylate cyclase
MADESGRWERFFEYVLSIGSYPGESVTKRGGRRVVIVALVIATLLTIPSTVTNLGAGYAWVAALNVTTISAGVLVLVAVQLWPRRFTGIISALFVLIYVSQLVETAMFGGLTESGLVVVFGLLLVLGSLIAIGFEAAIWWFVAFIASLVYAVVIPHWIDPIYTRTDQTALVAINLAEMAAVIFAVLAYFVRQRDRYQKRSDDLLHTILPHEIAERLKTGPRMIADDYASASVLFADLVDFTPMSAGMSPSELVGLLNDVFTTCDGFVAELGLEKIKTVGDEYMVAAGVPLSRPDHACVIAELALRIRDHFAANQVDGRRLAFRIGINSGPVTAGIIGTNKFSYDLWGDTVNAASRMESGGAPGSIQVSTATYELIKDRFVCESRGMTSVKGKGEMETFFLVSRRESGTAGRATNP